MTDVKGLLQMALTDMPATGTQGSNPDTTVDPAPDLARGRARLHRRHTRMLSGATAVLLMAGLAPVALHSRSTGSPAPQAVATTPATLPAAAGSGTKAGAKTGPSHPKTAAKKLDSTALVSYTGTQPQGYTVNWVPKGWVIQGGNPTALVIAPKHAEDQDPMSFRGKLTVLSASAGEKHDDGTPQRVDGRPGYVSVQDDTQILRYRAAGGRWVDVQAPTSLGWDGPRIAKFASGVTVLSTAETGRG